MKKLNELFPDIASNTEVTGIKINSKEVEKGDIFVCTMGVTADRHDFIDEAISNGACAVVVSKDVGEKSVPLIRVKDTNSYLRELCSKYYDYPYNKLEMIGITGTNGKTTTTTLTYEIIKASGKPVHLAGNIGYPLISFLDKLEANDIIVMEVSCQQLENMSEFKPHIALMTNLSVAHIDFLKSYENYKRVKLKLFKNQTQDDIAILNIENEEVMTGTKDVKAVTKYFSSKREINGAYYKDGALWYYGEKILDRDKFLLAGMHNVENALGAMMIAKEVGVDNESIVKVLTTFKGVAHRLEFVDEIAGVKYYNDTEATNTKCTQIALNSFNCDTILILGGLERGQDFHDLDNYIKNVRTIVGIGQCRDRVKTYGEELNINTEIFETLSEAMKYIETIARSGEVVLLSPASASWDQYKQCEDRGDEFKEIVKKIREKL